MCRLALGCWGLAAAVASACLLPGRVAAGSLHPILRFAFQGVYLTLVNYLRCSSQLLWESHINSRQVSCRHVWLKRY